jgi:hypothetical protein
MVSGSGSSPATGSLARRRCDALSFAGEATPPDTALIYQCVAPVAGVAAWPAEGATHWQNFTLPGRVAWLALKVRRTARPGEFGTRKHTKQRERRESFRVFRVLSCAFVIQRLATPQARASEVQNNRIQDSSTKVSGSSESRCCCYGRKDSP